MYLQETTTDDCKGDTYALTERNVLVKRIFSLDSIAEFSIGYQRSCETKVASAEH